MDPPQYVVYADCVEHVPIPLEISNDAGSTLAGYLRSRGLSHVFLLCDENTHQAYGESLAVILAKDSIATTTLCLATPPVLANEERLVEAFVGLTPEVDAVCSVGGGTLTDIGRFLAHRGKRPFISVPTAASVDGFYSIGAPLILKGVKRTVICRPPDALFSDPAVLLVAPRSLSASGFGDLIGKITSWADWNLGALLWDEPFDQEISDRLKDVANRTKALAPRLTNASEEDLADLLSLLLESGACMVDARESRPASGAEHHLSHYWEMSFLAQGEEPPLHGAKVGYATQLVSALYRELLHVNREEAMRRLDETQIDVEASIREIYGDYPESIARQLQKDQHSFLSVGVEATQELNRRIVESWADIRALAEQVPEPVEIFNLLKSVGAPRTAKELGIDPASVTKALRHADYLRNRFTILKLYRFLGMDPEPVARMALGGGF